MRQLANMTCSWAPARSVKATLWTLFEAGSMSFIQKNKKDEDGNEDWLPDGFKKRIEKMD